MLDFIYMSSADLFGTGRERKIQDENMFPAGFGPTPRQSTTGKSALCAARPRWLDIMWSTYSLTVFLYMNTNGYVTVPVWNRLWFDSQCKVL